MNARFLASCLLCLAMIFLPVIRSAHAAPTACGSLKALLKQAADVYHEFIVMTGKATGHQMVVTMSQAGTFTVFLGDGSQACVVLVGEKAEFDNGI